MSEQNNVLSIDDRSDLFADWCAGQFRAHLAAVRQEALERAAVAARVWLMKTNVGEVVARDCERHIRALKDRNDV